MRITVHLSYRRIRRYSVWRLKRLEVRDFSRVRIKFLIHKKNKNRKERGKSAWKKNENEKEKKREKKFRQVVLQTGNFHCRMGRVCGACGCPILGAVLGR